MRLGTTYTVEQSGALAVLDSLHPPAPIATVIAPSGQILRSAAAGDLDVIVTHAPPLERRLLVDAGRATLRCPFVVSHFAIVGPAADPAHVTTATSAADAMRRVAAHGGPFISRGDSSGTHVKELALWAAAGIDPGGTKRAWYVQAGTDQAATLHLADERRAYALADLPTLAHLAGLELQVLFAKDTALENPYTLYVVRTPNARAAATAFATWAMDQWRARLIALRLPDGEAAFTSQVAGCAALP